MIRNWRQQSALNKRSGVHRDRVTAMDATSRTCARCKERKPTADSFRRDSRGYWRSWCNPCQLEATREWRARNRDALLARRRAARTDPAAEAA